MGIEVRIEWVWVTSGGSGSGGSGGGSARRGGKRWRGWLEGVSVLAVVGTRRKVVGHRDRRREGQEWYIDERTREVVDGGGLN